MKWRLILIFFNRLKLLVFKNRRVAIWRTGGGCFPAHFRQLIPWAFSGWPFRQPDIAKWLFPETNGNPGPGKPVLSRGRRPNRRRFPPREPFIGGADWNPSSAERGETRLDRARCVQGLLGHQPLQILRQDGAGDALPLGVPASAVCCPDHRPLPFGLLDRPRDIGQRHEAGPSRYPQPAGGPPRVVGVARKSGQPSVWSYW